MNKIKTIIAIIAIALFAWVAVSYIDIIVHQYNGGTDAWWNIINIWLNIAK